jgi:hypothetical protein
VVTLIAFAWLLGLAVAPLVLWHHVLGDILAAFHWNLGYALGELSPWFLLLAGLAFMVPVAVSAGRHPESRLYPRARRVYIAWGSVLYLLGAVLLVQMVEVWKYVH